VPLYAYEPLPESHDPRDRFTMGSLWCLRKVITYLSLSICLSISSSLFNRHLWFIFGLYADLVHPRPDEEGIQGLRWAVRHSHRRERQVDAVLKGGCRGPRTTWPLDFVLSDQQYWMSRSPLLFDMYVEEYAVHRVLRQFGRYQE
jgi:hypothetical protein